MNDISIFAYKGYVGCSVNLIVKDNVVIAPEGVINNLNESSQLGVVVDAKYAKVSQEAINLLKSVKPAPSGIGTFSCFKDLDENVIFAWIGSPKMAEKINEDTWIARDSNFDLLTPSQIEVPEDFKDYVELLESK